VCVCVFVCVCEDIQTCTHTQQMFFGHFLTKEGIQKFLYLNIAAHSPVDPFLSQPYQKEREEERNKKKRGKRNRKRDLLTEKIGEPGMREKERGSVLQWKSTALTNIDSSCGTGPL
jgi:hypothetical protein